ncbi:glycerol-3-phosphate dehydrogenase/oxidase [Micromonospora endolithica]|uniref:Glycerol-3-phosphate dehydrogenase/oxidase n=1 Tax=Micromonospora endolithica TaxID=230091 RepID=A0A3A9ZJS0_9ACTN|nr:glycerol-3-phosphate dehydrogenase/oxidase [Micromonospora endolithica]RKN47657.1 glycerol-3-phosphate dehydrogenase/oxidase [Micromonospora endolithica]TWJ21325.1 glycerol-3-phosphate dehydrogenase [Micromonospora endolithica]
MEASLTGARRDRDLAELAAGTTVDVLVVGLGVTGAGVALDAASRGLSVVAVDAHDLAHGTSRWSSKLVHGGLRYLAHGEVGVAYESAAERHLLLTRTAPHLTRPLPMLLPSTAFTTGWQDRAAAAGLRAGDLLRTCAGTSRRALPGTRRLGAAEAGAMAPALRPAGLRGAQLSWDGQLCDDARLVVGLARAAAAHSARILPRCRAVDLHRDGATIVDTRTGSRLTVSARAVVNATGVWAGDLTPHVRLRPSRGTHIVLSAARLGGLWTGLTIPVPGEFTRYVFALPQTDGLVYAGLTDEAVDGPVPDVPEATEADIAFLLDVLNSVLDVPLRPSDVLGAYAGLRPLLDGAARTADISRRHAVIDDPDGIISVVGGKLTTYRRMAQDAVDTAVRTRRLTAGPCRTRRLPLPGAASRAQLARVPAPRRLVQRYGTEAVDVLAGAPVELHRPIGPDIPVTGAELLWAVRHELALTVDDLLDRRTRVGLVPAHRETALPVARDILARG